MAESPDRKWHVISLRLSGDALPVDELEAQLGIIPTHVHAKGIPGVCGELFLGFGSDGGQGWAEFSADVLGRITRYAAARRMW